MTGVVFLLAAHGAMATQRYVDLNSTNPVAPYTNWITAAAVIQDAVNAADPGDEILVTNGVYQAGGQVVYGVMNRVAVTKPVTVRSMNGPAVTLIVGFPEIGDSAVRCAYLGDGATLSGFTLTNGATRDFIYFPGSNYGRVLGGGVWCEFASGVVSNCVISGNAARYQGGGAAGGQLVDCTLSGNSGSIGGGAFTNQLTRCTLAGNSASSGGGADSCELSNCILSGNTAFGGGGANASTLVNCAVLGNESFGGGGGVTGGTLTNCTLVGNRAADAGGAAHSSTLANCIVFYNVAPAGPNYYGGTQDYCCTKPLPAAGSGNLAVAPQLADAFHLSGSSPCRGSGNPAGVTGPDIDGESWLNPPAIGCDEFYAGPITGPLGVSLRADYTNFAAGFAANFTADITGRAHSNRWDFGDGFEAVNSPYASHAWSAPGNYMVTFTLYNDTHPEGVSASLSVQVQQGVYYVSLDSANPAPPYATWATAASNIQEAVDVAALGGTIIVSNGVYETGGRAVQGGITNRVAVDKVVTVTSVNGPAVTVIRGHQVPGTFYGPEAVRCVYLTNGAALHGFTLTNGATADPGSEPPQSLGNGAGVWCQSASAVVSNCVITGNRGGYGSASGGTLNNCVISGNHGLLGGGAYYATLNNCLLAGNGADAYAGGASDSTLNNCTLVNNQAGELGGGILGSTLNNCIVQDNQPDNFYDCTLNHCLTMPLPETGTGNLTNAALFVNAAAGDFRLMTNSPGINAGNNFFAPGPVDLDGLPRIAQGTVDMGAFEFQAVTPLAPVLDATASGMTANGEFQLVFTGTSNATYRVWASTNLLDWELQGTAATVSPGWFLFHDAAATNWPQRFYRATTP